MGKPQVSDTEAFGRYDYSDVITTLKRILKRKKITYRALAARMEMSESGVKKIMGAPDGSFAKLAQICDAAEVDMFAVLELAWRAPTAPFTFNAKQDDWFASHKGYYYFFIELGTANGDPDKLRKKYDLDQVSVDRYVSKLEDLGLLRVLANGRIKFSSNVTERHRSGPKTLASLGTQLQTSFVADVYERMLASKRPAFPETLFVTAALRMTKQRLAKLNRSLHEIVLRHGTDAQQDELGSPDSELVDTGLLVVSSATDMSKYYTIPRLTRRRRSSTP